MNGIDARVIEFHRRWQYDRWMRYQNQAPVKSALSIGRRAVAAVERNQQILAMRSEGATLKAIGLQFGVSSERVSQICQQALFWYHRDAHPQ